LIDGEDPAAYDELLAQVSACVKPADILEDIWVREVVDLAWEAIRLRRLKANLMRVTSFKAVTEILNSLIGYGQAAKLGKAWLAHKPSAIEKVDKLFASAGLSMDDVMAQTLSMNLDGIERISRMLTTLEARRNAVLREVDRHRQPLGRERPATQQMEDGEFRVIEDKSTSGRAA